MSSALRLPRDPRVDFWSEPHLWPKDSKDHVFAARAIQQLGRAKFGESWSDDAPATILTWELPNRLDFHMKPWELQEGVSLLRNVDGSYRARNPLGLTALSLWAGAHSDYSPFPTGQEWAQAIELAKQQSNRSWAAFVPFMKTAQLLADACLNGQVNSAVRPIPGGEIVPKQWHFWNGDYVWFRFQLCRVAETAPFDVSPSNLNWWLYIERTSLDDHIAKPPTTPSPTVNGGTTTDVVKNQLRPRRTAGRLPTYEWDAMVCEFSRKVHGGEVTGKSSRQVANELADWAAENWQTVPELNTIADKVRRWRGGIDEPA